MQSQLTFLPTDDIIKELQVRLDRGVVGDAGLLSSSQMQYREKWYELYQFVMDLSNKPHNFSERNLSAVRTKMQQLADIDRTDTIQIKHKVNAVNTTNPHQLK